MMKYLYCVLGNSSRFELVLCAQRKPNIKLVVKSCFAKKNKKNEKISINDYRNINKNDGNDKKKKLKTRMSRIWRKV